MPTYADAIGYIRNLGHSEGVPWLEMICDLAASGTTTLSSFDLSVLVQLFTERASYLRKPALQETAAAAAASARNAERLEQIGPFRGFKRLDDSLMASFPKLVTIIFGANGSGKSSLCEALQILASDDAPRRPLHDIRVSTAAPPSFAFKFTSDSTVRNWTSPGTYGSHANVLKYFDSEIAIHNVKDSVQPGRIIELSPFKLDVFETARRHCEELRVELQKQQTENVTRLAAILEQIRNKFEAFAGTALATLSGPTDAMLRAEIELGQSYNEESGLAEKLKKRAELEKATSDEGVRLLKGEVAALKALHEEIRPILIASERLVEIDPVAQSKRLEEKEKEMAVLAKALIPTGSTLDKLIGLIRSANEVCDLRSPQPRMCPLCRQSLKESEFELFNQYSSLLTGELEADIAKHREVIKAAEKDLKVISDTTPDDWARDSVLPSERIEPIKASGKSIQEHFKAGEEIPQAGKYAVASLRNFADSLSESQAEKETLVRNASRDREGLLRDLHDLSVECQSLLYAKEISANIDLVKEGCWRAEDAAYWDSHMPSFTPILRKITATAKTAHKELVVEDFKTRLNTEYLALAEREMSAFGVELKDVGGDGVVTVDHHVSGQKIEVVLSEGEQRIHALALFFAEMETCEQQVFVFDDPVSSFDYNYIGNYCNRLRDFIQAHPDRQIVVLTHNWEFFVQMQTTLNRARLNGNMSVHVLESCVALDEYSENIDDLKSDIEKILAVAGEPSRRQKETMAGKMRRLIEAVVNTHVFNKQRHQYKQKSQQVSAFDSFTEVVRLLPAEARSLRDLFEKLSVTEHDDPRNAYVNTDKAMFESRYRAIKNIETAIIARR